MSRQYEYERTTRRTTTSFAGPRRTGLAHWIPLGLTVLVATVGIAAWIWSERNDDDEDEGAGGRPEYEGDSVYSAAPTYGTLRPGETAYGTVPREDTRPEESSSYMARMSGALRRTPSPQQFLDGASRTVVAGVAAAGAAVGTALSSIREDDKNAYKDHKTWSEEAEARATGINVTTRESQPSSIDTTRRDVQSDRPRKTIAVVVSADSDSDGLEEEESFHHEHASVLSHLPTTIDFSRIRLFVLVYAPALKEYPRDNSSSWPAGSLSSSFSNISHTQALTPGEELEKTLSASTNPAFNALWSQARILVEKDTMVLPFTTPNGHLHILRHLAPDFVYLQESLSGRDGENVTKLQTWLRQDVVLVVGADGGHGGLADSESEAEQSERREHWWEKEERTGRGRGLVVVEGLRVGDDWARRIEGRE